MNADEQDEEKEQARELAEEKMAAAKQAIQGAAKEAAKKAVKKAAKRVALKILIAIGPILATAAFWVGLIILCLIVISSIFSFFDTPKSCEDLTSVKTKYPADYKALANVAKQGNYDISCAGGVQSAKDR